MATATCLGNAGVPQSSVIVAKLSNGFNSSDVFSPIRKAQSPAGARILACNSESQWEFMDWEGKPLSQPLTIQCAYNHPEFTLSDMENRPFMLTEMESS
jgi:hypothetical protein